MNDQRPDSRRGLPGCLLVAGAIAATGLLAVLLFVFAVNAGLLAGPGLELQLGDYYLVARSTEHPACLPLPQQCFIPRPTFRMPQPRYYTVWAGRLRLNPRGKLAHKEGRLVLQLPIQSAR